MSQPIPSETAAPRKRLGRGLSGLLGEIAGVEPLSDVVRGAQPQPTTTIREIPTTSIGPSPFQPRRVFDQDALARLAESIKAAGIMQPILLRRATAAGGPEFELVAGERRWRAATLAGLATVPAVVSELDDARAAQWALIENLQRQDLGAMERAWALRGLCERFGLTQAQAAERVGLDRTTVTNLIRVTELEAEVREMLDRGELSLGHGKALLAAPPGPERVGLASRAAAQRWS
ncbi:MAG TPA: ParB/RepB/Spo0J family partition protein, partial [Phycisphaerales bacterium]|nr:ParB/RepB/Spo0J family partition protein [Phycisphaerales bacterium]